MQFPALLPSRSTLKDASAVASVMTKRLAWSRRPPLVVEVVERDRPKQDNLVETVADRRIC